MTYRPLFKKEFYASKHRIFTLIIMLVFLPAFFGFTTVAFQDVVPEASPLALVPADDATTQEELELMEGVVSGFTYPVIYDDYESADAAMEAAMRDLKRERVYVIIEVPSDLKGESDNHLNIYLDGSNVPFDEPSTLVIELAGFIIEEEFGSLVGGETTFEKHIVGFDYEIGEYLIPILFMIIVLVFSFGYIPFDLGRESAVVERLEIETSLEKVILTKLAVYTGFMVVALLIFQLTVNYLDYQLNVFSPLSTFTYITTFFYLSMISIALMVASEFRAVGRYLSVMLLFYIIMFSAMFFPRGMFSSVERLLSELNPVHYSLVMARSGMMKEISVMWYLDFIAIMIGTTIAAAIFLKLSIVYYRRKQ